MTRTQEYTTVPTCIDDLWFDLLTIESELDAHLNDEPRLFPERNEALKLTQAIRALLSIYAHALCDARLDLI